MQERLTIYTKWRLQKKFCIRLIVFQLIRRALMCKILSGCNISLRLIWYDCMYSFHIHILLPFSPAPNTCGMGQFIAQSKHFLWNNLPTYCEELGTVPKPTYDLQLLASSCNSVIILMFFNVRLLSHSKVALVICVSICPELEVGF